MKIKEQKSPYNNGLIIIPIHPGKWETNPAVTMVENLTLKEGKKGFIFSLELTAGQFAIKLLGKIAKVDITVQQPGENWPKLVTASRELSTAPIYIDDTHDLSINELSARAKNIVKQYGLDYIIIDHLQLISPLTAYFSRPLKALAKELNIPVIVLFCENSFNGKNKP